MKQTSNQVCHDLSWSVMMVFLGRIENVMLYTADT